MQAFDTETLNRKDGGYAVLLTNSAGDHRIFPASFASVFEFLAVPKDPYYMCWNMDFDARASIHEQFVDYAALEKLALYNQADFSERGVKYTLRYIPRKFLRVQSGRDHFELYDLQQFYGGSLRSACKKYLGESDQKQTIPASWYNQMDKCLKDPARRSQVVSYGVQDAKAVLALFHKISDSFDALGLKPKKWISPASLSMQLFGKELRRQPRVPFYVQSIFQRAFYGGRVEVGALGKIGRARLYDLHSAYPSEAAKLPSLTEGYFHASDPGAWAYNPLVLYGAYELVADVPTSWSWGPLAVRHGTELLYPVGQVRTWCCLPALRTLRKKRIPFRVLKAYEYISYGKTGLVFSQIRELYQKRKIEHLSLAIKLVLNSLYGKLCESRPKTIGSPVSGKWHGFQRVETRHVFGKYTNFILASHLTESVRMKVWEALHKFQGKAYFTATDSVLVDGKLPTGPDLGEWGEKMVCTQGVILGCGRYYLESKNGGKLFQFRGFNPKLETLDLLKKTRQSSIVIQDLRAGSLAEWTQDGGVEDFNVLKEVGLKFQIKDTKRHFDRQFTKISAAFRSKIASQPYIVNMEPKKCRPPKN